MNGPKDLITTVFNRVDKISRKVKEDRYALTTCIAPDLVCLDGKGSRITVLDNGQRRSLIDASAAVSTKNIGYGNDMIKKAIRSVLREYRDITGYPHHDMENDIALNLAWILTELTPLKTEREVIFANSGAEGIEAAIKLCYNARSKSSSKVDRRRRDFVACFGAFHGRTLGALSLTC